MVVGGVGGISSESQSRWCRFEWVFSVSARPGFIQQPPPSPGDSSASLFPLPPLRIPLLCSLTSSSHPPQPPIPTPAFHPIPGPDCRHLYARGAQMARRQATNRGQSLDRRWNGGSYSARYRNDASSSSSSSPHIAHHTAEVEGLGVGWEKKKPKNVCQTAALSNRGAEHRGVTQLTGFKPRSRLFPSATNTRILSFQ